ncbi:hypothetical protein GCM10023176_13950 [Micromonospora coerulea]|uniref:Uncharacterized protein n=1 Tax=Micromonospora coerulea TaxID=47856 RepID=A0ABP8SAL5_9ACTN
MCAETHVGAHRSSACAELALRVLRRGAVAVSEQAPDGVPVTADRIAVGAAHRDQAQDRTVSRGGEHRCKA